MKLAPGSALPPILLQEATDRERTDFTAADETEADVNTKMKMHNIAKS